jgi:HAD superfamily hydrolase (TIGR01458 family)
VTRSVAILLDVDGVLHVSGEPVAGAAQAVTDLRRAGHGIRFVTNNTTRARADLADDLRGFGVDLADDELQTTPRAAAHELAGRRVLLVAMAAVHRDLEGVELVDEGAEAVLVGGCDEGEETAEVFAYGKLNRAFLELDRGAELFCLHKNRWWLTSRGPLLDAGAFVAGLEYAADREATVLGKPSRPYFEAALAALDSRAPDTIMVGDDLEADVAGAQRCGLRGVLVRTGKFREDSLARSDVEPDAVLDSIADLPEWLREIA